MELNTTTAEEVRAESVPRNNSTQHQEAPEHLLLMVNGLFGSAANWAVIRRNLAQLKQASRLLMVTSNANLAFQTFDGVDNCGKRLADELRECIAQTPSLKYVSVIGHSMGGLIARYTLGMLYDADTGLIAGLKPRHFISLATPHLGCGGEGPAQVPFIGWPEEYPVLGSYATKTMQYCANTFASVFLRRTGEQFFLLDGTDSLEPLLVRMVEDGPLGFFYSALKAFASRSCYANSSGDHIVGWANASVRHPDELPDLGDVTKAKGVVRADPVAAAMSSGSTSLPHEGSIGDRHRSPLLSTPTAASDNSFRTASSSSPLPEDVQQAENLMESSEAVLRILQRLQTLPWCRMDTSFRGTTFPYFAHNLIQVTREWINWEGENVVKHLTEHFAHLEDDLEKADGLQSTPQWGNAGQTQEYAV